MEPKPLDACGDMRACREEGNDVREGLAAPCFEGGEEVGEGDVTPQVGDSRAGEESGAQLRAVLHRSENEVEELGREGARHRNLRYCPRDACLVA